MLHVHAEAKLLKYMNPGNEGGRMRHNLSKSLILLGRWDHEIDLRRTEVVQFMKHSRF